MAKYKLGEKYKDKHFGFEGVLVGLQEHMYHGQIGLLAVPDSSDPNQQHQYLLAMDRLVRVKNQEKPFKTKMAGGRHKVKFGQEYTDGVMGTKGIAIARTEHLTGCERVTLQYPKADDGALMNCDVDEEILKEVPKPVKPREKGPATAFYPATGPMMF